MLYGGCLPGCFRRLTVMANALVPGLVVAGVEILLAGCTTTTGVSSSPTTEADSPSPAVDGAAVNCGPRDAVIALSDLRTILIGSRDLQGSYDAAGPEPSIFDDLGDDYFRTNIEESRFSGGSSGGFISGDILEGGDGRLIASRVSLFADEDAAATLLTHPFIGEPDVERHVETTKFGDNVDARYFERTEDGATLAGYILQFRVGRIVLGVRDLADKQEDASLEDIERYARLMCDRLREVLTS